MQIQYVQAADLNRAWLNFELDLPLEPGERGEPNPFYVNRPGNPLVELEDTLLAPYYQPPKFFFSGHRGSGKSTELRRLAANSDIQAHYWPVHFTIRDEADINDLDFRDILLAIGGRMYREYTAHGGKLPEQLLSELESWRGQVQTEVKTNLSGPTTQVEAEGKLSLFFVNVAAKMKLEPATRAELRQVFERNITGLVQVIDDIATTILTQENKMPLVLIDDLDKPDLERAKQIFHARREIMRQPNCAIVYTASSALFYSKEFDAIRDQAIFLPNIKLHSRGNPDERDAEGYATLEECIYRRMRPELLTDTARSAAITFSGGVFRELARIMRSAIGRARRRKVKHIEVEDVEQAVNEIRNEYRRFLEPEDLDFLREVHSHNRLEHRERLRPLLQLLALLEYRNDENWCDIHPALEKLLEDTPNGRQEG